MNTKFVCHAELPQGFVDLETVIPDLIVELAYASADNFTGRAVDGYQANRAILTCEAAKALAGVQQELGEQGLGLKIFDAYRPLRAVDDFLRWAKTTDSSSKTDYFPAHDKSQLFKLGYLGLHSAHCRGSTVDLTIVDLATGEALDMGTSFDFFDRLSWSHCADLLPQQRANRALLASLMDRHGFNGFEMEWWHFTLRNEPHSEQSFDFIVL